MQKIKSASVLKKNEIYFSKNKGMETMNFDFANSMDHNMLDLHMLSPDHSDGHSSAPRSDDDDDDDKDDEDDARDNTSDEDPALDKKVVHSPLPTDNGGKPKS